MFYRYMQLGGLMMWPLLVCSILLVGVLWERMWVVGCKQWLFKCKLSDAVRNWHRRILPFFMEVPPSIGLLGTVVGVVRSFQLVDGRLDGNAVGGGLAIACMTTIFGLSIAIVASVAMHILDWTAGKPSVQKGVEPC